MTFLRVVNFVGLLMSGFLLHGAEPSAPAVPSLAQNSVAVEALKRLEGVDIYSNPALEKAVLKVLATTRGTPQFVELVKKFKIRGEEAGLLEVAAAAPSSEAGVEAMRLALNAPGEALVKSGLSSTNPVPGAAWAEALGNTGEKGAVPLLQAAVETTGPAVLTRRAAARGLARTREGAAVLLALAREEKLAPEVRFVAGTELNAARWPEVKAEAARLLPLPEGRNAQALPPVAELLRRTGDPRRGAAVFRKAEVGCINCHRVRGEGRDVGPDLSEIGAKLGKDALYEAILDPSAGISFGYEAFQVQLKSGDEAYGLIVSDTAEELALKDIQGIVSRFPKKEIVARVQSKLSIMPAGLQQAMSPEEFVDLVEYLASLKKAGN